MTTVRRALFFSFIEQYAATAIGIVSTMVLSRLVTPRDVGIFSVAYGIMFLLGNIRDFGVASYLIQEKELTEAKFQSAFGVSMIVATMLIVALFAGSGAIARFYGEAGVGLVIQITAVSLIVIPFTSVVIVLLRREMRFDALFHLTVVGALCHGATGITLAELGFGYQSMAWANVANCFGTAAVAVFYRPKHYRSRPSLKFWRTILAFGFHTTGANLLSDLSLRSSDLIVGRVLGLGPVGLFSRASSVNTLVDQSLLAATLPVALAAFARRHREDSDVRAGYLEAFTRLSAVTWPALLLIAAMAFPIIRILFGSQWDDAVPLARILAIGALFGSIKALHTPLFQAVGQTKPMFRLQLILAPFQIVAFLVGAQFGLTAVALAASGATMVELAVSQFVVSRVIGLPASILLRASGRSVLIALLSAVGPFAVLVLLPPAPERLFIPLVLSVLGAAIGWVAGIIILRHPLLDDLRQVAGRGWNILRG